MDQGDDLPPPYSAGPSTTTAPVRPFAPLPHTSSPSSSSSSSLFTHHLSNLRSQILAEQAARASDRDMSDARLLALLVPCVEELLSSIATVHPPPRLVEAALVPASAVGPDWHFSDQDERRDGELRTVMRVDSDVKGGDTKTAARDGRDGRDGHGLWWGDEDTARRLAKCLNPEGPVPTNLEGLAVRAHVKEAKRASRWGLFRRDEPPPPPPPASQHGASPSAAAAAAASRAGEDVVMTVDADEVTFRRENEMGIWESRTGWGIVVRVRIRSGHI